MGFEPTIPAFERATTLYALDRAATVIGVDRATISNIILVHNMKFQCNISFVRQTGDSCAHTPGPIVTSSTEEIQNTGFKQLFELKNCNRLQIE
jgi:hypothetical protein